MLVIFLFAIDATIVSTAMPTIVARLGGLELYSWVFSIYMLTSALTTPLFGKLSDLFSRRRRHLCAVVHPRRNSFSSRNTRKDAGIHQQCLGSRLHPGSARRRYHRRELELAVGVFRQPSHNRGRLGSDRDRSEGRKSHPSCPPSRSQRRGGIAARATFNFLCFSRKLTVHAPGESRNHRSRGPRFGHSIRISSYRAQGRGADD